MDRLAAPGIAEQLWPFINKRCVVWVGAGLSAAAGYPQWSDLISRLCAACNVEPLNSVELSSDDLIDKAEECKRANSESYHTTLARIFGQLVAQTRQALYLLMKLPFQAYITTNFDLLLSSAGALHDCRNVYSYPSLPVGKINRTPRSIFHIHGRASDGENPSGENLILARSDFDQAYGGIVRSFLEQLLVYHNVLFLGCSLTEPAMQAVFQRVHEIHVQIKTSIAAGNNPPKRFVLLPTRYMRLKAVNERDYESEHNEDGRFRAIDVNVIRYDPGDARHGEIEDVLEQLCTLNGNPATPLVKIGWEEEELQ
jgi:SIR2-like domain